jgi:hypothetical protein
VAEGARRWLGELPGGVRMFEMPMIDQIARLRKDEIYREVAGLNEKRTVHFRPLCASKSHLDFNIRLVLQPRLSLSIWVGRGVR